MRPADFSSLLQRFFADRLVGQLGASPNTIAGYRDTFRLLIGYAADYLGRAPSKLKLEQFDAAFVGQFLDFLENERGNSSRTRNTRLAAVRAFFRYVSFSEPAYALQCQRILAIPAKRYQHRPVEFLTELEAKALINAPNTKTWIGRRDRTLLLVMFQTGLRNSEITSLKYCDVELGTGAHVRCLGKGRKTRCTPLQPSVAEDLTTWLSEGGRTPDAPVFPSSRGGFLSADALQRLVVRHTRNASRSCQSLIGRSVTPHTLRHSAAMSLLRRGVDITVIALWLGHESTETTQIYLHADMKIKERALAHATSLGRPPERFQPTDTLLAFLERL